VGGIIFSCFSFNIINSGFDMYYYSCSIGGIK
jgi:hypothetical protein